MPTPCEMSPARWITRGQRGRQPKGPASRSYMESAERRRAPDRRRCVGKALSRKRCQRGTAWQGWDKHTTRRQDAHTRGCAWNVGLAQHAGSQRSGGIVATAIGHIPGCLGLHGARMLRQRCAYMALKKQAKAKQDNGDDAHGGMITVVESRMLRHPCHSGVFWSGSTIARGGRSHRS